MKFTLMMMTLIFHKDSAVCDEEVKTVHRHPALSGKPPRQKHQNGPEYAAKDSQHWME